MSSGFQLSTGIREGFHISYAKKVQVTEELDVKWKYDGATNIFEILDDQISN